MTNATGKRTIHTAGTKQPSGSLARVERNVSLPLTHVTRAAAAQVTADGSTLWAVTLGGDYRDMDPAVAVAPSTDNSPTTTVYLTGSFRSQMRYNGAGSQVSTVVSGTEFRDLFLATVKPNIDMRSTCIHVMRYTRMLSPGAVEGNARMEMRRALCARAGGRTDRHRDAAAHGGQRRDADAADAMGPQGGGRACGKRVCDCVVRGHGVLRRLAGSNPACVDFESHRAFTFALPHTHTQTQHTLGERERWVLPGS